MYIPEIFKTFAKKVSTGIGNAHAKAKHMAIEGLIAIVASIIGVACVAACLFGAGLFTYYTSLNLLQSVILVWATVAAVVYSMNKILPSFFQINMSNITARFTSFNLNVIKGAIRAVPSIIFSIARQAFSFGSSYADSSIRSTMGLNPTEVTEPVDIDRVIVLDDQEEEPAPSMLPKLHDISTALSTLANGQIENLNQLGEELTLVRDEVIEDLNQLGAELTFARDAAIENTTGFFTSILNNVTSVIQDQTELDTMVATHTPKAMPTSDSSVSTMTLSPSMDSMDSILPEDEDTLGSTITEDVTSAPNEGTSYTALYDSVKQDASDLAADAVAQIEEQVSQQLSEAGKQLGDAANSAYSTVSSFMSW